MIIKKDKDRVGYYYYIHEESGLNLAHDSWEYSFSIKYCLKWLREYRKSLTYLTNIKNDNSRKKLI